MLQKYHRNYLLNLRAIYEALNADNARTLMVRFDDKLPEIYVTNDFIIVRR